MPRADRSAPPVVAASFGLACWHGRVDGMAVAHRHDDLELNLSTLRLEYAVDGRSVSVPAGVLAVFWAARPHRLTTATEEITWMTVPLGRALAWSLPSAFLHRMLAGEVLLVDVGDGGIALTSRVRTWTRGLAPGAAPAERRAAELEMEALALRVAARSAASVANESEQHGRSAGGTGRDPAGAMAAFASERASGEVRIEDIARHVHLNPQYAMTVFRRTLGITIGEYVLQCRIARAQQLLLTTAMPVPEVGFAAGFRSQSQFYARFRERCGEPPAAYRRRLTRA